MSPRSQEFMDRAEGRLRAARHSLEAGDSEAAVSLAYYAMLYAARAALSERDVNAKTHSGVWTVFQREFAGAGEIEREIASLGPKAQRLREQADYEGDEFSVDEARTILAEAERFIEATAAHLS